MKDLNNEDEFLIPEMYGNAMMSWARAEHALMNLVERFSANDKILKKLRDPKGNDPNTYELIQEIRVHACKEYEEFTSACKERLTRLEDIDRQKPGEYAGKSFDDFIKGLDDARKSRNSLAHEIAKMEMWAFHKNPNDDIKKILPSGYSGQMIALIGVHSDIISRVSTPTIEFLIWLASGKKVLSVYPPKLPDDFKRKRK